MFEHPRLIFFLIYTILKMFITFFSFSFVHFRNLRPLGVSGTHQKLESTYVYTRLLDAAAAVTMMQQVTPRCR